MTASKTPIKASAAAKRTTSAKRKADTDDALNKDSVAAEPDDVGTGRVSARDSADASSADASADDTTAYDNRTDEGKEDVNPDETGTYADDPRDKVDSDPRLQPADNHVPTATGSITNLQALNDHDANVTAAATVPDGGARVPEPVWTGQNLIYNPDSPVPASPSADPPPMIYDPPVSSLPPGRILPRHDVVTNPPAVGEAIGKSTAVAALEASDDFVSPEHPRPSVAELSGSQRADVTETTGESADHR